MTEGLFDKRKPLVGVIHVGALPGTPRSRASVEELTESAAKEAGVYRDGGVDALMIENMHDVPYLRGTGERRDRREASDTPGNRTQSAEES
jgi:predicted TIM-barrel enzyme